MALSQLRGAEPATWHWASYVALSQLRGASKVALSFELARRQWASKIALSFIIYMQSQAYNILNLGQKNFFEGDTYLWAGAGMWNLPFEYIFPVKIGSKRCILKFKQTHLVDHCRPISIYAYRRMLKDIPSAFSCRSLFEFLLCHRCYWVVVAQDFPSDHVQYL